MKVVDDDIYMNTLTNIKKYITFSENPINFSKKILINLMPTFAFKQLIIFIRLGEFLKKNNIWVDYFICNGYFNHCDIVKMNDEVDRYLICERCQFADDFLNLKPLPLRLNNDYCFNIDSYLKASMNRFCGENINFKKYKKETKENLKLSNLDIEKYDFLITLNHFENYSIAPLVKQFHDNVLLLGISEDRIILNGGNKNKMCQYKFDFDDTLLFKIENYLSNRFKNMFSKKNLNLNTNKKIVVIFTSLLEDAFEEESNVIFSSNKQWLVETTNYLLENDFYVIIKAHPDEQKWKPFKSVLELFKLNKNLKLLPSNTKVTNYELMEMSDYIVTYNGTVFYEGIYLKKQVVLGGKICDIYHTSKKEYFEQFSHYKPYSYEKSMKYAYLVLLTKAIKLEMIDLQLSYPHIKNKFHREKLFDIIFNIVNNRYYVNNHLNDFDELY